ncbi:MAG: hypothetical protein GY716_10245, partial [bacterium]|nr:hypothetical protein [bacterium]
MTRLVTRQAMSTGAATLALAILCSTAVWAQCVVPDNGGGTVTLPPAGCAYLSPDEVHEIIDGLPAGTTIELAAIHQDFICRKQGPAGICSFPPPFPGVDCDQPGGSLGGEQECSSSLLHLELTGTGVLGGYVRSLVLPVDFETHTGPRVPGAPVQSFPTDMFRLQGELFGDPDFDLLRITAGTDFGLPSPGHTTLTQLPGGNFNVDSFFDIEYRIEFVGAPGGLFDGQAGTTTATIRMGTSPCGNCDDNDDCTIDTCNEATGQCINEPLDCDDSDPCTHDTCGGGSAFLGGNPCVVADNGGGTVTLPPAGCDYLSPDEVHEIINDLPAGTTIELAAIHRDFICREQDPSGVCSFPPGVDCEEPGGSLGGERECTESVLELNLTGTGVLAGYSRVLGVPVVFETHVGPRNPGDPVQSFDTDMFRLQGELFGDPDFDLLRITAGTDYGLPSPGHTTLTQLPSGNFNVDSFFDITYQIEFVGAPGGPFDGESGTTTGTLRMETGDSPCTNTPVDCDDNNACTLDSCDPTTGECVHEPIVCDDGDECTVDSCDPATGQCIFDPLSCDDGDPCTVDTCEGGVNFLGGNACTVPDNGSGTVTLPPAGCDYLSPDEVHEIINDLPAGTTIELAAIHKDFICRKQMGTPSICSFTPSIPGVDCDEPGGSLGGEKECSASNLELQLTGTGLLGGFSRTLFVPVEFETHTGPRNPGDPVQSFNTDMFRLQGELFGDPDFDLLRITAGTDFGLPSPGHTTLTQLPGGDFNVDSFFDITYQIEFVGAPGSVLDGESGTTTGTLRMETGDSPCTNTPVDCDDNNACTLDSCDPTTGECLHEPIVCFDGDDCTVDSCDPATGQCIFDPLSCDDGDLCTVDTC